MDDDVKGAGIGCVILVIIIIISAIIGNIVMNEIDKFYQQIEERKEFIGDEVIYKNDTLLITNYDHWNTTYKLENGEELHFKVIEILKIIKSNESKD